MTNKSASFPKERLIAFVIPAAWLALLGLAALLRQTSWGQEGHPSNSTVLFIYALLGAPLIGLAGGAYAWVRGKRRPDWIRVAAIVANACVMAAGAWFWLLLWFK